MAVLRSTAPCSASDLEEVLPPLPEPGVLPCERNVVTVALYRPETDDRTFLKILQGIS